MTVTLSPSRAFGRVRAPASKSYAHRMMIAASLAGGKSHLSGMQFNQDIEATLDCLCALGVSWQLEEECLTLSAPDEMPREEQAIYPCRESGSTLRFLLPLALYRGGHAIFTGTERLLDRGVGVYEKIFCHCASFQREKERLHVTGSLLPGEYTLPGNVSSQFVSGLLFALPLLPQESRIILLPPVESRPYIAMTVKVLQQFGIRIEETGNGFFIPGGQHYHPADLAVEGDWSGASALLGFNAVGGEVEVEGLARPSAQGDSIFPALMEKLKQPQTTVDIANCPDLGPELFAIAACLHGGSFTGTARLRIKESDRAAAMAAELKKLGIRVDVEEDSVTVFPGGLTPSPTPLSGHNDHRIVMALCLPLSIVGGSITQSEAVGKSFPGFFKALEELHVRFCHETE